MNLLRWSKSASAAALAFTVIAACSDDPLEPVPGAFDGVYAATSVGGEALPRTVSYVDVTVTLLADTLRFYSDGVVTRTTVVRNVPGNGGTDLARIDLTGTYSVDGIRLTMGAPCPINALCVGWPTGTIIPSRVTLPYSSLGDKAGELVLTRIE